MAIHLKILTELDRRRVAREAAELKRDFETYGRNSSAAWAKGFEANSPKIRAAWTRVAKAADAAADSQDRYGRAVRNTAQVTQRQALTVVKSIEKVTDAEERHRESIEATAKAQDKFAKSSARLGTRRSQEYIKAARTQVAASRRVDEQLRNQQRLVKEIAAAEEELAARKMLRASKDVDFDFKAGKAKAGKAKELAIGSAKDRLAIDKQVAVLEKRIIKLFEDKEKSLGAITDAEGRYNDTQQKREELGNRLTAAERENLRLLDQRDRAQHREINNLVAVNRAHRDAAATRREAAQTVTKAQEAESDAMEKSTRATRDQDLALRSATDSVDAHERALGRVSKRHKGFLESTRRNLGALTPLGTLTPGALIPVVSIMGSAAEVAVTTSQSLALLPAVATAAAAGIGTLTIGLHGFGDTIKDMGDPKKFAEGLQQLSPNAQQAALEVKALVDGPLGDLKRVTQDALFNRVPETLHNLANVFTPTIEGMTTSIATSFNTMFRNLADQLMTPDMQGRIGGIVNNITAMFKALEPVMTPLVDAFTRITETGAGFLPGLATSLGNLVTKFDNFIIRVQSSGELQEFMQKGIDAAKALGEFLLGVGQDIYEVFGNKSPEEFRNTLESVRETIKVVAQAIVGISEAINDVLPYAQGLADAAGGWENLFIIAGTAILAWKTRGVLKVLADVAGIGGASGIGAITKGLDGVPAAATKAADGIFGAFTRLGTITVPIVLGIAAGLAGTALLNRGQNVATLTGDVGMPEAFGPGQQPVLQGVPQAPALNLITPPPSQWGSREPPMDQQLQTANLSPYAPHAVPEVPGPAPSQTDQLHAIMEGLDPSLYQVDPYAGMTTAGPSGPSMYQPGVPGPMGSQPYMSQIGDLAAGFGLTVGSGLRSGPANASFHNVGQALDVRGPMDMMRQFATYISQAYGPQLAELIWGEPGFAGNINQGQPHQYSPGTLADHYGDNAHVHVAAQGPLQGGMGPVGPQYNAFGQQTGFGANIVDPQEVQRADYDVQRTARELSQAKQELLAKEKSGLYDAIELQQSRDEVADKEQAWREAQQKLAEAQMGNFEKYKTSANGMSKDMQQIGAELDKDFGISKGLPGIAENLTKFLANLAFAPVLGALSGVTAAYGTAGKGTGVLGMLAPRTNAFGQPMPNIFGQYADEQGNLLPPGVMPQQGGGQGNMPTYGQQPGAADSTNPYLNPASWGANWEAISMAESAGDWQIPYGQGAADNPVTGGLQIGDATWRDNGGLAYGVEHAYQAPKWAQIAVAENVLRSQGPGAWPLTFVPRAPAPGPGGMQAGGMVPGYGNGDKVPALLEPGELVVPRDDVSSYMDPSRRGVMGLQGGGYLDEQGNWHPYDPNEGRTEPNAGTGIEPPQAPPHLPFGTGPGQIPFAVDPANRKGNPIPSRPPDTVGPFGLLPGQTPPGEHQTYIPGQPMPGHPLPMDPGGVLHPLPPREVEQLPTKPAGRYPGQGLNVPHGQGIKPGGGIIGLAESAAVSAAGMAGGLGSFGAGGAAAAALAQIGIDEINRAIQYGGQVAGIAVQGLMETFLPNESPLADIGGGWVGRIASAAAGASAGTANIAGAIGSMLQKKPGEKDQKQPGPGEQVPPPGDQAPPAPPGTPASGIGAGPPPGPVTYNATVNNVGGNENQNASILTDNLVSMHAGPGR